MPTYNFNILYNHEPQNPVSFSSMILFFGRYGSTTIPPENYELTSISDSLYHIRCNVSFENEVSSFINIDASIFLNIVTLGLVTSVEFNFTANYNCYDYYVTNDTTYNTGNTLDDWCIPWQFMLNYCGSSNYILDLSAIDGQSYNQLFSKQTFNNSFLSNYGSFQYVTNEINAEYIRNSMTKYSDLYNYFEKSESSTGGGSGSQTQTLQYANVEIINNLYQTITVNYYSDYTSNVITNSILNVAHGSNVYLNNEYSVNCSSTNSAGFGIYPMQNLTIEIYSIENPEFYTTTYPSGIVPVYTLVKRYFDNFGINETELNYNTIDIQFTLSEF